MNTFNKVWILPDKAGVYVHDNTAFVVEAHLKVMLEEDYLSLEKHTVIAGEAKPRLLLSQESGGATSPSAPRNDTSDVNVLGSQIVREIVLPELEKEINVGKNFATLRQIFNSMILATWYKKNLKEALLNQVYSNKSKINGVDVADKTIKEQIYQEYLKAYKKGVFNYIKEDIDEVSKQPVPRKYFSGGLGMFARNSALRHIEEYTGADAVRPAGRPDGTMFVVTTQIRESTTNLDLAMQSNIIRDVLRTDHLGLMHREPSGRGISLREKFQEIQKTYEDALQEFATASIDPQTKQVTDDEEIIKKNQRQAELKRMAAVREMYDIGRNALAIEELPSSQKPQSYAKDYIVAMLAFKKVMKMQTLLKHRYSETVRGSEYTLANDVFPTFMSTAEALRENMGEEYLKTLDLIKDARQKYIDAYQRHVNVVQQKSSIGYVAAENIIYGLGLSDEELFWGINADQGRSTDLLNEMALALRSILFYEGNDITYAHKAQAAAFLEVLFNKYMHQAKAARGIDQNGGLTIPEDVYEAVLTGSGLKEAEMKAFGTYLFSGNFDTLKGPLFNSHVLVGQDISCFRDPELFQERF